MTSFEDISLAHKGRLQWFWRTILKLVSSPEHGYEEQRKRLLYFFLVVLAVPILTVFAALDLRQGEYLESAIEITVFTIGGGPQCLDSLIG